MPEEFDDGIDDESSEAQTPLVKQLRQKLREQSKVAKDAADARKELALIKAGVDTDSRVGKLFAQSLTDFTDIEAIKAEAQELGCLVKVEAPAAAPATGSDASTEQSASQGSGERDVIANGAAPSTGEDTRSPGEIAIQKAREIEKTGATFDDVGAGFMSSLATSKAKEIGLTEHRR